MVGYQFCRCEGSSHCGGGGEGDWGNMSGKHVDILGTWLDASFVVVKVVAVVEGAEKVTGEACRYMLGTWFGATFVVVEAEDKVTGKHADILGTWLGANFAAVKLLLLMILTLPDICTLFASLIFSYLKVLDWGQEGQESSSKHREAFEKEVAVWQKLDHPNVTKFVGASMGTSQLKIPAGKKGGSSHGPGQRCVVVVEYQHGGTLKTLLFQHRDKKLPYKKVVQLALDMARGLSYLHSQKIVHRDVKAENMLLDRKKSVKIADFGVARVEAQDDDNMTGQTGTLGYMAPEVLEGRPYDHKCDVYSFGVLLWETYCCALAYPNYSIADISYHVVKLGIRPDIPRCCPKPLSEIMTRCWDGNPDHRPEMAEVVAMLERIDTTKGKSMTPAVPDHTSQGCSCFGFSK
ncbi:Serine/threonine-protein kinase HT1 [Triticum urartu]|uniref:Serine/threonine-protein kinase HT1 n=1 Tax=Triticum urartu TaxID=4572 RepID=M7Z675_TRIUA|nr:Serine/threonine-protein kinase HT1 [Triticum urartu]